VTQTLARNYPCDEISELNTERYCATTVTPDVTLSASADHGKVG
jgi:hypothetical protein